MLRSKEKPQQNDSISYYLKKILQVLDSRSDVTEVDITRIELPYIQALNHHGHPTHPNRVLALHRVLSKDTEVFITFLSWMYRRKDGQADTVLSNLPQEEKEARASFAYLILSEWEFLPGQQNDGGEIDEVALKIGTKVCFNWPMKLIGKSLRNKHLVLLMHDMLGGVTKKIGYPIACLNC